MTLKTEQIAKICHAANRAYCQALGDHSLLKWSSSPDEMKARIIDGIMFHHENPGTTPEQSHENWLRKMDADGWIYGVMKNPVTKEHPCIMPYHELPADQRLKDHIFCAIVSAISDFDRDTTP